MSSLRKLKNRIKSEPIILIKKPWLGFLIPVILGYIIINRLKSSETKVFLTETEIYQLQAGSRINGINGKYVCVIIDFKGFTDYAIKRISEDTESEYLFLNVIKKRFQKGDFALVYLNPEGEPLSYVFICTKLAKFTAVGINLPIPARSFGMYDVYTYKNSRGKGYYSLLFYYAIDFMQQQGYNLMWLWLMAHNSVSINIHYKLGIKNISKILTEKINFGFISHNVEDVKMSLAELISHE